jgi:hypothetical protein
VAQILESNHAISVQLRELIARRSDDPGSESCTHFGSNFDAAAELSAQPREDDAASVRTTATSRSALSIRSIRSIRSMLPSFTEDLKNSRAYKRAQLWGTGFDYQTSSSFTNSTRKGGSWSMLSDMSLGGLSISEISVFELPVHLSDLWDRSLYEAVPAAPRRSSRSLKLKWSSRGRIHNAVFSGEENVVRNLLAMGADIEESGQSKMTPLLRAIWSGQLEIVKLLIENGADMYARDFEGWTVLHCATASRKLDVLEYLLENGGRVFVNARDGDGNTVVCWSLGYEDLSVIEKLVEAGASLNLTNVKGETPFQVARRQGASSNEIANYLWSQLSPDEQLSQGPRFGSAHGSAGGSHGSADDS